MFYLLEDNRIIDSMNEKDISELKWDYNCEFHSGQIYFYKPRNNYNCKEACGRKGDFCVGCKDAFKAKFNKIKKQSDNVFDLIEKGDLITVDRAKIYANFYIEPMIEISQVFWSDSHNSLCVYPKGNGYYCPIIEFGVQKGILAIYKPNSKGDYIKVWEEKDK